MKNFKEKLALVPHKPGSYQMKNSDGVIIYVGKAKDLNKRLRSYFTGLSTGKTRLLVENIDDFEYIVTSSELESLILEITLIKKYDPKYNILLRDDKTYPYIELTTDKYPIVKIVRNTKRHKVKSNLFGPYPNATAARRTVEIINRLYPLRKCDPMRKKLCLYYHIHECLGYCEKEIDKDLLDKYISEIKDFLRGHNEIIVDRLTKEMNKASLNMNYEKALEYKQMCDDINTTLVKQKIDLNKKYEFDLINYYLEDNFMSIEIFFIRDGLLYGRHNEIINVLNPNEELVEYIIKFYDLTGVLPKAIYTPDEDVNMLLSSYFNIELFTPKKGKFKELLDLAKENAKEQFELVNSSIKNDNKERFAALEELKKLLKLKSVSRMEAYDNSHLFGTNYVGGVVVFDDFIPNKNLYRKYKINSAHDDIGAMKEVIYRRYYKVIMENLEKPDLIVMDGGIAQISAVKEILQSLNVNVPIIGLVKDDKHRTNHIMNQDLEVLDVPKDSKLFLFLTKIQDEVHRYAISYHRNLRSKGLLTSRLDMIEGIGETRRNLLIKKFGSLKKIKEASIEEIEEILPKDVAKNLISSLNEV